MKRMFRVVLAFVVVACGLTLPAMETVSAQVATITPTATDTNPLAGKTAAWTRRVTVGQNENVDVSVYKDFAYGTRGDASDEGEGYRGHWNAGSNTFVQWYMDDARGGGAFHRHRSGQYFDVFVPSNRTATSPVLIYLHGGSWSQCYDKDGTSLDMLASIAAKGYVVITADYILQNDITEGGATTLREGATFTAMLQDIDSLVSYLTRFLPAMGVTPTKLAIGGVSAGGHLSSLYAYDQAMPERLGLNLAHAIPVAVELDLVGPTDLGGLTENISLEAMRQLYGENAELVLAMFTALFEGVTGTASLEAASEQMALFSPLALVCDKSPKTIAGYCELTDANGVGTGTDGAVRVSDFHGLTNALAAAGVECKARLNLGVAHGELDNPSVAPASVEWIVASMDQALKAGWFAVEAPTDPEAPPPSAGGAFAKKVTLTLSAALSDVEITDGLPTLVRLSEDAIPGFRYGDFALAKGGDLKFTDAYGEELPHEVDTWDTAGESLVWVRLPSAAAGTSVTMYWGNGAKGALAASDVWNGYVGVWHLGDPVGTSANSSPNGSALNGVDTTRTLAAGGVAGKIGQAKVVSDQQNADGSGTSKNFGGIYVPHSAPLSLAANLTISGWFKHATGKYNWDHLFYKRSRSDNTGSPVGSFALEMAQGNNSTANDIAVRGSSGTAKNVSLGSLLTEWTYLTFVYDGGKCRVYCNGALKGDEDVATVTANEAPLVFGNNVNIAANNDRGEGDAAWYGSVDEIRLVGSSLTESRIRAEYAAMTAASFGVGQVEELDTTAVVLGEVSAVLGRDGVATVTVPVVSGVGAVSVVCNGTTAVPAGTADGAGSLTASVTVPAGEIWSISSQGRNDRGTVTTSPNAVVIFNGAVGVEKVQDAKEDGTAKGVFRVTRPSTATAFDLVINLGWSGSAAAGTDYVDDLPTQVTIPAGETSVDIEVSAILNAGSTEAATIVVTVLDGGYQAGASAQSAIQKIEIDTAYRTWVATEDSDGLASTAANWAPRGVPQATDKILFDGRFSSKDCLWDVPTDHVASWTQDYGYAGCVTLPITYEGRGAFNCLTVAGEMKIASGMLTHPQSRTMSEVQKADWNWLGDLLENELYRLRLDVGSLVVGADGTIDTSGKGYYATHDASRAPAPSHGGWSLSPEMPPYGNPKEPVHIGMPYRLDNNYFNGKGGGAVYITVKSLATVDGTIRADSNDHTFGHGSGAAGSVYLNAVTLTGSGAISADGLASGDGNCKGTGGRVAIVTSTPVDRSALKVTAVVQAINAQNKQAQHCGSCGTVYFWDESMTHGVLVVDNIANMPLQDVTSPVLIPSRTDDPEEWTFDRIEIGHNAVLAIPEDTEIHLPGGIDQVVSLNAAGENNLGSIRYEGGVLDFGRNANQTMHGRWMFTGRTNYTFPCSLTVTDGAVIGVPSRAVAFEEGTELPKFIACSVGVNGDLFIAEDAKVQAQNCGFRKIKNDTELGLLGYLSHGGRTLHYGKDKRLHYQGYDSVFAPFLPGCGVPEPNGQACGESGGVIRLAVSGCLTVNGPISANGLPETHNSDGNAAGGAGGAIDITAGTIVGAATGRITAEGGSYLWQRGVGGRIAIKLTAKGADFSGLKGLVSASGRCLTTASESNGSTGSVYLKTGDEADKAGTIVIASRTERTYFAPDDPNTTEIASLGYGGDALSAYRKVKVQVGDYATAAVNADLRIGELTLETESSGLDLEGHKLTVDKFLCRKTGTPVRVSPGTYTADKLAKAGFKVTDSSGSGSVEVTGGGYALIIR